MCRAIGAAKKKRVKKGKREKRQGKTYEKGVALQSRPLVLRRAQRGALFSWSARGFFFRRLPPSPSLSSAHRRFDCTQWPLLTERSLASPFFLFPSLVSAHAEWTEGKKTDHEKRPFVHLFSFSPFLFFRFLFGPFLASPAVFLRSVVWWSSLLVGRMRHARVANRFAATSLSFFRAGDAGYLGRVDRFVRPTVSAACLESLAMGIVVLVERGHSNRTCTNRCVPQRAAPTFFPLFFFFTRPLCLFAALCLSTRCAIVHFGRSFKWLTKRVQKKKKDFDREKR